MARTLSHRVQSLCQSEEQGEMFSNVCVYLGNQTLAVHAVYSCKDSFVKTYPDT